MNAVVLQSQLVELLKQARKTRPTMKAAGMGSSKYEKAKYALLYGSVTLRALPSAQRVILMQQTIDNEGKTTIAKAFIQANVYAPFVVSVELDTLYEWVKLAPAGERLELHCVDIPTHSKEKQVYKSVSALRIVANRCSARFKDNGHIIGENPIPVLTASDTWELWASAPETPLCGEAPCPMLPLRKVDLMDAAVKEILQPARTANLDGELITLSYIIPANTALGTDRWIAHSGRGETHLKLELYKEQVGAIKLAGYEGEWFKQNKPFRCTIYVILDKNRNIKEVLSPEPTDPDWTIMDGSPAPEKVKKWGIAGRKVDQTPTQAMMERAKLCMKLGLPLDASDKELEAMQKPQEAIEYAPAGYVQTVHPSELQPGDVFIGDASQQVVNGDTFIGHSGSALNLYKIKVGWLNIIIRSFRGNYLGEALDVSKEVTIYRDPAGHQLNEEEKQVLRKSAFPESPSPKMGWVEDGQGGVESKWV